MNFNTSIRKVLLTLVLSAVTVLAMVSLNGCSKDDPGPKTTDKPPTIKSVSPNEGSIGTELTIIGTNFTDNSSVLVGDKQSTSVEVGNDTVIYALVPTGIPTNTLLSVTVKTSGGEAKLDNAFKAISPVLSFVNSATKPSGNIGSTVILEGIAFGDIQGTAGAVLFSDGAGGTIAATIASADDWTNTFIVTTVPSGSVTGPVIVKTEVGTSNALTFTVTTNAAFSPSEIAWTGTTDLPLAVSGHHALSVPIDDASAVTKQYVYVSGGRISDGTASNQLIYGKIASDGTIGSWPATTSLPSALSFHTTVAATPFNSKVTGSGYIYVLGGINSNGTVISTVSFGTLNNDGTIQATWGSTTQLPQPLYSAGAVIFRGSLYVVGGSTTGGASVKTVYRSVINENGQLGTWQTLSELTSARTHHGVVSFGGYLYCVGGETTTVEVDDGTLGTATSDQVLYSKINLRTGEIGSWTLNSAALGKTRSKHTTLVLGGSLFVSSGLYSGLTGGVQGSSENIYAVINSDGSVGSFNGATGSNTLFSEGGSNLFNLAGISYIDAEGVAHVMILGGAKVGSPTTKLAKALFY